MKSLHASFLFIFVLIPNYEIYSQHTSQKNKLKEDQAAYLFSVKDVNGDSLRLSDFRGKKILLTFNRNVGCPVCNLRFHELQEESEYFKEKELVILSVYESSAENMKIYLINEKPYAKMIPNPDQNLYVLYNVERSNVKFIKSIFFDVIKKRKQGEKLFKSKINSDGNTNRISADFMIDEKGNIIRAYYGKYVGDHLSIEEINNLIEK